MSSAARATSATAFSLFLSAPAETEIVRKEYGEALAAYCCLGVLQVAQGDKTFTYLLLVTDCQSLGKVGERERERERERAAGARASLLSGESKQVERDLIVSPVVLIEV